MVGVRREALRVNALSLVVVDAAEHTATAATSSVSYALLLPVGPDVIFEVVLLHGDSSLALRVACGLHRHLDVLDVNGVQGGGLVRLWVREVTRGQVIGPDAHDDFGGASFSERLWRQGSRSLGVVVGRVALGDVLRMLFAWPLQPLVLFSIIVLRVHSTSVVLLALSVDILALPLAAFVHVLAPFHVKE